MTAEQIHELVNGQGLPLDMEVHERNGWELRISADLVKVLSLDDIKGICDDVSQAFNKRGVGVRG
jgi:hypothetical protein